ncbi:translocase [Sulfitobacter sp. D35]|uniref:preprotein translocase subunit SecA n=1 Tax=Sulfitobacter sp. D35 TaxID=3083252 RepID=UPI00296E6E97|nr:translocase [Sulfitobacter sp. D35]MDW4496653.1 translocase [Sulfitobacter sp. D35]
MSEAVLHQPAPTLAGRDGRRLLAEVYAERSEAYDSRLDRSARRLGAPLTSALARTRCGGARRFVARVAAEGAALERLSDADLHNRVARVRTALRRQETLSGTPLVRAFALVREAAFRTLGIRHYDVQVRGAYAMARGAVAEMRTGEGKTLTAVLVAAAHALAGRPVHVITSNDYLARRDGEEMGPLYHWLGLGVGIVQPGQTPHERRAVYAADVVYGTNKEIAFDYLRDRIVLRDKPGNLRRKLALLEGGAEMAELRLRGLHVAIVDEADSVMIDEARTPLLISRQGRDTVDLALFERAREAAASLVERRDFRLSPTQDSVELTEAGRDRLEEMAEEDEGAFRVAVIREHAVTQALAAAHVFRLDEHYIVRGGKVMIVDEFTGRTMADRSWSDGLHQMIELKEGLEPTPANETLARMTYQRFFRRYRTLAGMTGTARGAAWEFWSVYGLPVVRVPTNKPDRRRFETDRVFSGTPAKWDAIDALVAELHAGGHPVLLGTKSVASAEEASRRLDAAGVPHQVLSASQDAEEAEKIARAGMRGMVTVATNMAGRGVDIRLPPEVAATGGLTVILSERHDSQRVDLQLAGRCGRQGDPGRVFTCISLGDDSMLGAGAAGMRRIARAVLAMLGQGAAGFLVRHRQRQVEQRHARMRRDLLEADKSLRDILALSGQGE